MFIPIGEIVKPQGVKGEVKIKPFQTDCSIFKNLKLAYLNACPHKLRSISLRGGFAYVMFEGISDRNAAELLTGKTVTVDKRDLPKAAPDEYYICDIIGCEVRLDTNELVGTVNDVQNFGSADVYTVTGKRTVRFPFLKKLIISVDIAAKIIVLDAGVFSEVCVYED